MSRSPQSAQSPGARRYGLRLALGVLAIAVGPGVLGLGSASADPANTSASLKQQADKIAAQINALQPQVDAALLAYNTALDSVADSVSASVAARRVYEALQQQADAAVTARDSRVAALYESGGTMTLYADVLVHGNPTDLHAVPYLASTVTGDADTAATALRLARAAQATLDATHDAITKDLSTADAVDQRLTQLQGLLGQQQALLDQASAQAKHLQELADAAAQLAASRAAAAAAAAQAAGSVGAEPIPTLYRSLFQAGAATCPGLPWSVLAAIGQVETNDGRGGMVSSAGALGPMQFLPATFMAYAVDGNHDGQANIMDPADAVFSAAHYLCANGAGQGGQNLYNAVWHYNHADWYVQLVLSLAAKIS